MNRNLRALRRWIACGLAVSGVGLAWAQMPVPLLDAAAPAATSTAAAQQLEALLQCKAGTVFKTDEVESKLQAIGLAKGADGFFLPMQKGNDHHCSETKWWLRWSPPPMARTRRPYI